MDRRQQLLKRLDKAWCVFKDSYAGLPDSKLLELGVTGAWSVRDIIAHVTTWEEEALKHLPLVLRGKRPPRYSVTYGGIDAFNARRTFTTDCSTSSKAFPRISSVATPASAIASASIRTGTIQSTRMRSRSGGSGGRRI